MEKTEIGIKYERTLAQITQTLHTLLPEQYKDFKNLPRKNQNLRDHMTDWELLFTMVGEKATTDITIARDAQGLDDNKSAARRGGQIAHNARKELEQETGNSVVSKNNFLGLTEKKKIEHKKKK